MFPKLLRQPLTLGHAVVLLALGAVIGGGAFAVAAIPGPDGRIKACVKKRPPNAGAVRVIDHNRKCTSRERTVRWSQRGPAGAPGAPGTPGTPGTPGPSTGAAGGDLQGSYPDPTIKPAAVGPSKLTGIPVVEVTASANQSIPNNTNTAISWNTESVDVGNMHDNTSPSILTAPIDGVYQVNGSAWFASNATGLRTWDIRVNGSAASTVTSARDVAIASAVGKSVSGIVTLSAGEFVQMVVHQNSGGALDIVAGANNMSPHFSMHWIGPAG